MRKPDLILAYPLVFAASVNTGSIWLPREFVT
jgi:hypothetical protein